MRACVYVCVGQEETDSSSAECEEKGGVKKKKRHIHGGKPHLLPTCSAGIFRSEISSLHLGSGRNIGFCTLDFQQVANSGRSQNIFSAEERSLIVIVIFSSRWYISHFSGLYHRNLNPSGFVTRKLLVTRSQP